MNDKMAIFIFSVNVINRLLLSFLVLTKVITLSGVHCTSNVKYRHFDGVAMSSPLGQALANIFVGYHKANFLRVTKPLMYSPNIDDTSTFSF